MAEQQQIVQYKRLKLNNFLCAVLCGMEKIVALTTLPANCEIKYIYLESRVHTMHVLVG